MRVAQVLCAGSYAGAEAVATRLCAALRGRADASILYVVRELRAGRLGCDQLVAQVDRTGVERRVFDVDARISLPLMRDLVAALRRDRIDVLHVHAYKVAAQVPLLRRGAPLSAVAFTVHGFDQHAWRGRLFVGAMDALGAYGSDRLVCVSSALATHYRRYPGLRSRVRVIANAAPPSDADDWADLVARRDAAAEAFRTTQGLGPGAVSLLAVGRLIPVKNLALLLDAVELLRRGRQAVDVRLFVVGDGPLRPELEAQAARLKLPVHFTGLVSDVSPYYRASSALVLSSDSEGSPMVVLEALAHGLPVVARAVGGVPDMVRDGREGLLVSAGTPSALAEAIERVAVDPALRQRLGRQAWERARTELAVGKWAERHLSLYREMVPAS